MAYLKNIASAEVLKLADQVQYAAGQVVSKTLVQNKGVGITLFAFAKGEGISEHESTGDAFVTCLDGKGKIMIDGKPYFLEKGESIVMPANHPHAVYGEEDFKMMLVVVFSSDRTINQSSARGFDMSKSQKVFWEDKKEKGYFKFL